MTGVGTPTLPIYGDSYRPRLCCLIIIVCDDGARHVALGHYRLRRYLWRNDAGTQDTSTHPLLHRFAVIVIAITAKN